jgi:PAS domain S-box-containing protein
MRMPEGDHAPWHVVIVDDDADDRAHLRHLLLRGSERRYEFTEAETAAAGAKAILREGRPPDCALIDYHLPDAEAHDVLVACGGAQDRAHCPALVLTGTALRDDGREVLKLGAQDFLGKGSLTAQSLTRAVENAVDRFWLAAKLRDKEAAVRESEARLRLALEASSTGLWTWQLETDQLVWSPEVHQIVAVPEGVFAGTGSAFFELVHPDDRARVEVAVREAIARRTSYECEFRMIRPDGSTLWVEGRGRAHYGAAGAATSMLGTVTDVSRRKATEERLRRSEFELRTLAENTPDILTRFDRELRHVFVNRAVEKATGQPRERFIGKTNRELGMAPALCDQWEGALRAVLETGTDQSISFAYEGPAGTQYYEARLVAEVGPDGRVDQALVVTQDVTERARHEQTLLDNARRKDEFLATLAHELRNPLAPIRTGVEVLKLGPSREASLKVLGAMERQLVQLVRLVDDLMDVSRIRRGVIELKRERVDVRAVLERALETSGEYVRANGHTLDTQLPDEPIWIDGDPTRLAQVVSNLLNNSAKYTPFGGHVRLAAKLDAGHAEISVTDNGVGLPAEDLPNVFELFSQAKSTLDRSQGGLGIGLSLARQIVTLHGGAVAVESAGLGQGSTFRVRLPIAGVERVQPVEREGRESGVQLSTTEQGQRVLVVDDNRDAAELLAEMLSLAGNVTRIAHDGPEALAAALAFAPQVILLDLGLPGIDGFEVARRLRSTETTATKTVLVAVTGWGGKDDKRRTRDAGFDFHLTKPIQLSAILDILARTENLPEANSQA